MDGRQPGVDPWRHEQRWRVRRYEIDSNGHVNNAVYLNWIEQLAAEHAAAMGFGPEFEARAGGSWVIREHLIRYHQPAFADEEIAVITLPREIRGARGLRRTEIRRVADGTLLVEAETEWVWVRRADGRPTRVPAELRDGWAR